MAPTAGPPVYVFGSPRSGTTWVQNMLGAHPEIAAPQELELFSGYLEPWYERWETKRPDRGGSVRYTGLAGVVTAEELDGLARAFVDAVYDRILALKPGASIVLEKSPGYTRHTALIHRVVPEARFVHVIRDGRDVAASLIRASRSWGRGWAPHRFEGGVRQWAHRVRDGREAAKLTEAYHEVRYEQLRSSEGPERLCELFQFCGVDVAADEARSIYEEFELRPGRTPPSSLVWGGEVVRVLGVTPDEPSDFFGEGASGAWRDKVGTYERWAIDRLAGDLLVELGYERDRSWAPRTPLAPAYAGRLRLRRWWRRGSAAVLSAQRAWQRWE